MDCWTLYIVRRSKTEKKTECFGIWIYFHLQVKLENLLCKLQYLKLALSKGPNLACDSLHSTED
jgi:hypothetical protein